MELTVRFAAELGYDVTVVKDGTADYSDKESTFPILDLFEMWHDFTGGIS
jgi:hypothetical protein